MRPASRVRRIERRGGAAFGVLIHSLLAQVPFDATREALDDLAAMEARVLGLDGEDASAIIGIVGSAGGFQLEMRLNRAPLPEEHMAAWLERLLGYSVVYAPLPPFV